MCPRAAATRPCVGSGHSWERPAGTHARIVGGRLPPFAHGGAARASTKMPDVTRRSLLQRLTPAILVSIPLLVAACASPAARPAPEEVVIWKELGSWSGRGNVQTESFVGLTGALRMHWRTMNPSPADGGTFRLVLQSAISGRELRDVVEVKGAGEDTAYVAEDPRVFFMSVEAANLDWSFTVEEAVFAQRTQRARPAR
jgi:hypothetical protein